MEYPIDSLPHAFKTLAQKTIISGLQLVAGAKDLVIETVLISPLDLVCGVALLRSAGVDKIYKLEPGSGTPGQSKNTAQSIRRIAELISADESSNRDREYFMLCVPQLTTVCERVLEENGVYGRIRILDCPVLLFPLDMDVISMERSSFFNQVFLERETAVLSDVTQSLLQLQELGGCLSHVNIVGSVSRDIASQVKRSLARNGKQNGRRNAKMRDIVLMDRDADVISFLASQLTYEGVLDETFGIECGKVFMPKEILPPNGGKHVLDSRDTVFSGIRDLHLSSALIRLRETGSSLKQMHSSRKEMPLSDMKEFIVTQMKDLQTQYKSLNTHISACEAIMKQKRDLLFAEQLQTERNIMDGSELKDAVNFLESFIVRQVDPHSAMRLLCLMSVVQDGLPSKQYRRWCRLFAQSFGNGHVVSFSNLQKVGLLVESTHNVTVATGVLDVSLSLKKKKFREKCKRLNLIPSLEQGSAYDVKSPQDSAFVFGGAYSPLIVSLLDSCVIGHAQACRPADLPSLIPDLSFDSWSSAPATLRTAEKTTSDEVVVVFFIGGVTFAEISAVRFWGRIRRVRVLILTTGIVNGKSVMQSLMQ